MDQQPSQAPSAPNKHGKDEERESWLGSLWNVIQIIGNLLSLVDGEYDQPITISGDWTSNDKPDGS